MYLHGGLRVCMCAPLHGDDDLPWHWTHSDYKNKPVLMWVLSLLEVRTVAIFPQSSTRLFALHLHKFVALLLWQPYPQAAGNLSSRRENTNKQSVDKWDWNCRQWICLDRCSRVNVSFRSDTLTRQKTPPWITVPVSFIPYCLFSQLMVNQIYKHAVQPHPKSHTLIWTLDVASV